MNIFIFDTNPVQAAKYYCDKHCVKIILEITQMLCTVSWKNNIPAVYKPAFRNHPVTLWVGKTYENWKWALNHGLALCQEYTRRYNKIHKCQSILEWCKNNAGRPTEGSLTPFAQAMPEKYKQSDAVKAYRNYFNGEKLRFAEWKLDNKPNWAKNV